MDLVSSCKEKLQYFRIKELKDVLTQLGLSKQGKKQDLVDRILAILAEDQGCLHQFSAAPQIWAKKPAVAKEEVARLLDDIHRKMQVSGAIDLASKVQGTSDSSLIKPKQEVDDSFQQDIKVRCPCGNSLLTESMIQCEDHRCQIWQHIRCVIIPEKPTEGIPPLPSQFYCTLCRLQRADPFWSTVAHSLYPVKLLTTSMPTDGTNPVQGLDKTFHLTRSDRELLSKPEYAVQVWCMLLNDKVPFRMQWPQYADLQVNGVPVRVVNRPGSQLLGANGRDDGPNISQCTRDGINKISLTGCDARAFCVGVRLVKRRTLEQILNMIPKESNGEHFEDALTRVCRCVGGGGAAGNADSDSDLEIVADAFTINLRCPMSGSRMKVAGRFRPCAHMGCFDLKTFVEMQQRSRKWQCPICLNNYSLENLIIDPYFNRITTMMQSCDEDTTEIEVKPDGSWRVKNDNECRDFRQWHLPDGSVPLSFEEEAKHKSEAVRSSKQEVASLRLGIRKNSNGVWEFSKHRDINTLPSGDGVHENFENGGQRFIPMSSSATGSGGDGEDPSVNQDGNGNFDLSVNNGMELDSVSLNLEPAYGLSNVNASAAVRGIADVIVLSDSDEENGTISHTAVQDNGLMDNKLNFAVGHHGISGSYQEDPGLGKGGSSCLGFFNPPDDVFGLPPWQLPPTNQAGSTFQLFDPVGEDFDALANSHPNSRDYATSMNGDMLPPEASLNPIAMVPDSSADLSNNDLNDGLFDNPFAFGREDPSLQIFLPTGPSDLPGQADPRNQQDMANGLRSEDWISLRLGDSSGISHVDSFGMSGLNSGQQNSREGATDSGQQLHSTASFLLGSNGSRSEKTRERSGSPFSFPRQKRSVRPRLYLSIDSDSE